MHMSRRDLTPRSSRGVQYALLALLASLLAAFIGTSNWGWSQFLNSVGVDACFRWRGPYDPEVVATKLPQSKEIVIVELPHEIPRSLLAQLIHQLRYAKVVGLDLMFSDREKDLSPDEKPFFKQEVAQWRRDNALLASALKKANNVVIGSWSDRAYQRDKQGNSKTTIAWAFPVPVIESAARWRGHLGVIPDEQDRLVRRVLLWQKTDRAGGISSKASTTSQLPAFGLCLAAARLGVSPETLSHKVAQIAPQEMLIDYLGPRDCFETNTNRILYDQVLYNDDPESFRDAIVLVGETSYSSKDTFATPYGDMPGLFIHANIAATLLSQQGAPRPIGFPLVAAFAFITAAILLTPLLLRYPMWMCLPVALVELVIAFGGVVYCWIQFHSYLPLSVPILALFFTYNAVTLYEYVRARGVLRRVVGSEGTEQLLDALVEPELGGREEIATAFFCDLRGYTTLSQHMPPQSLIALLNLYTDALVQEVLRFGGRPIDYFGDGVFVLFEGPQHASRALQAAIHAQEGVRQRFLELLPLVETRPELSEAAKTPPEMGVALHTGSMVIGLVGSLKRPKPGAVGDAVNVASRVQGLSSVCGMSVLFTRTTLDALGDWKREGVNIKPCGIHAVKGRDEPVEVFGVEFVTPTGVEQQKREDVQQKRRKFLRIFPSRI